MKFATQISPLLNLFVVLQTGLVLSFLQLFFISFSFLNSSFPLCFLQIWYSESWNIAHIVMRPFVSSSHIHKILLNIRASSLSFILRNFCTFIISCSLTSKERIQWGSEIRPFEIRTFLSRGKSYKFFWYNWCNLR